MATTKQNSVVPAGAKRPADHKVSRKGAEITVDYNGTEYTVPGDYLDNVRVIEQIMDNLIIPVLRGMLGADQWEKLLVQMESESEDGVARMADFEVVLEKFFSEVGPTAAR